MNELAKGVFDRVNLAVNVNKGLANISIWLTKYTRLDGKPFSFKDHEMQIAICNDTNRRTVIQKCSQVGMSELAARKALATAAMSKGKHLLYVLPTRTFATKFSSSRLTPIIEDSPMLKGMVSKSVKSTELKQIGTSFMHLGGTSSSVTGAISVPATYLIHDEFDFMDLVVAGKFQSRLKHASEDEFGRKGWISTFSTPTVPEYAVNAEFLKSDQKHYAVRCQCCDHEFIPDYFEDIKIPDYDGTIADLDPADIERGMLKISEAYMACPECSVNVKEALEDPKHRRWIATNPDSIISGYQIHPWDVPKINSIPSILMQMPEYENQADYFNFTVGIPWVDKENSFVVENVDNNAKAKWIEFGTGNYFMGVDVGKTSNIVIGQLNPDGSESIVYLERYKISGSKAPLFQRIIHLCTMFRIVCCVVDAAPDFTTALEVIKALPLGVAYACEYTRSKFNGLDIISIQDNRETPEQHVVKANRTGTLQDFLRAHNSGLINYPNPTKAPCKTELAEVKLNLKNTKKIRVKNADGDIEERFVKTGPDHYAHAINYFRIAVKISGVKQSVEYSYPPSVKKFKMKDSKPKTKLSDNL